MEEHDALGNTFTVRLLDGTERLKYFVEAEEIRAIRCGAFAAGRRVVLRTSGKKPGGSDGSMRAACAGSCAGTSSSESTCDASRACGVVAHVDDFDEETETYTVRLLDGRARYYVEQEELREVR